MSAGNPVFGSAFKAALFKSPNKAFVVSKLFKLQMLRYFLSAPSGTKVPFQIIEPHC
jgi:hypothetical protein